MVLHFGGLDIHIPKIARGTQYTEILSAMGPDATKELMRVFGGEQLYIAKNKKEEQMLHKAAIAQRRANGETWRQIAKTYNFRSSFSERWVRKLGGDASASAPPQPSLFDFPEPHPLDALSRRN